VLDEFHALHNRHRKWPCSDFYTKDITFFCERRDPEKASFTFGCGPRPKHANRIPQPKVGVSLVVKANVRSPQRGLITTLKERIVNDRSALTDEVKLGEDNSDLIKVYLELNSAPSPRASVRKLATEI